MSPVALTTDFFANFQNAAIKDEAQLSDELYAKSKL